MNLARWNMIVNPVCALCQSPHPTSNHISTGCPVAWHHDSVLQLFVRRLLKVLPPCYKLFADLPGYLASASPPSTFHLSSSLSRPDIMLLSSDSIILIELSVVTNTKNHSSAACHSKQDCMVHSY